MIEYNIMKISFTFDTVFQVIKQANPQQFSLNHFVDAENLFLSQIDKTLISHRFNLCLFCLSKMLYNKKYLYFNKKISIQQKMHLLDI